jgi:hypothetical protein
MWSQSRQPPKLFSCLTSGIPDTRQPHYHVLAEPVQGMLSPSGWDRLDGKVCPLGKLCGEQLAYERYINAYFTWQNAYAPVLWATRSSRCTLTPLWITV